MVENEAPFSIRNDREGMLCVCCNLPLAYFAGEDAQAAANKLASRLNTAFKEIHPELTESMQEADKVYAELAKRKYREYMYQAVRAVLETQRDAGQGPMDWRDIYNHPDLNFSPVIGSVFGERPPNMKKVRQSIRNAVRYLQSKGWDIEAINTPGRGLCYSLC